MKNNVVGSTSSTWEQKKRQQRYPICQTYVDTVLSLPEVSGICEFCQVNNETNQYYLYDTPMSRRPWVHRPKRWEDIDAILNSTVATTPERRHPKILLSGSTHFMACGACLYGNIDFVGRKEEIRLCKALKMLKAVGLEEMNLGEFPCWDSRLAELGNALIEFAPNSQLPKEFTLRIFKCWDALFCIVIRADSQILLLTLSEDLLEILEFRS